MEIRKVLIRKDGIKYLIVPKKSDIKPGSYVKIIPISDKEVKDGKRT